MSSGTYTGMAPGADILFGKTTFFTTDILIAIQDLISFAEAASKPIPLNLSLGLMVGPHDGTSGFESGIDSLAAGSPGSKRLIAVAAGNETGANEHFQATVAPFGTASTTITLKTGSRTPSQGNTVEFWGDGNDQYSISITLGSDAISVPAGGAGTSSGGRITVSNGVAHPPNGATLISIFFTTGTGTASIQLTRTRNGGTGSIDAYIEDTDGTFNIATNSGTITEPANGSAVIAVGSFDTKTSGGSPATQNLSSFSSLGPTRDGRLKPDVTAPGCIIYSAKSLDRTWPPSELVPGDNDYVIMAGTSMATPHVTGIAALAWQSNPALTGAQMRERIKRTANPATDGSTPPPNTTWGYGKVNALAAVRNSVASITAPAAAVPGSQVSLASENSSGAFGNPLTSYTWSLTAKPAGSGAILSTPMSASSAFTPDVPGNYTVALTASQGPPTGASSETATAVIHVNTVPPLPTISGQDISDNLAPVNFHGAGSDPDGLSVTFQWILVSRPAGSNAQSTPPFLAPNGDNVTLTPDVAGTYIVGLRVDDGLDNSVLAVHTFTATGVPASSSGSGGGGCSVANRNDAPIPSESASTVLSLLLPAGLLAARRRIIRTKLRASRIPPPGRPAGP
jgi:subtilisin family serine protease